MKKVYLHGYLGKKFGKLWELDVHSVSEAVRAIDANTKGALRDYWTKDGRNKKYQIKLGDYAITSETELDPPCGEGTDIHIVPYIAGRSSGFGKILAAIAIVTIAYFTLGGGSALAGKAGEAAGSGWFGMTAADTASMFYMIGAQLVIGGIIQLLTPVPNFNTNAGNNSSSNIFDGNSLRAQQGDAVPVVYGRMLLGPIPVSVSIINQDRSISTEYAGGGSPVENTLSEWSVGNGQIQYSINGQNVYTKPGYP